MKNPLLFPDMKVDSLEELSILFQQISELIPEWDKFREHFFAISLDSNLKILGVDIVSKGCSYSTIVTPQEAFRYAITSQARSVIFAHNHPSGILNPSQADWLITRKLIDCGTLLNIKVLDVIIFCDKNFRSVLNQNAKSSLIVQSPTTV